MKTINVQNPYDNNRPLQFHEVGEVHELGVHKFEFMNY